MNGQLSEQPLAELIREIFSKSLGGRLRLEHERVKVVAYFDTGKFVYAASNLRTRRLREYLKKAELVSDKDLAQFNERVSDSDLVKVLCAQKLLSPDAAEQVQARQAVDVLRMALLWTEGSWDFDSRSRLNEPLHPKIDLTSLLLEAARRLPSEFAKSRFRNPAEVIAPLAEPLFHDDLLPAEGFLLSRLDRPTTLRELIALSGLGEEQVLGIVYALALADLLKREAWPIVLAGQKRAPKKPTPPPAPVKPAPAPEPSRETEPQDVERFLARVKNARTHYEILDVGPEVPAPELKTIYYQLARRYHPDRFRRADPDLVHRLESAFARIRQAYDTLRDDALRASYNAKIAARRKVEQSAAAASTVSTPTPEPETVAADNAPFVSVAERAANHARRGQMLATKEATRRAAEAELTAAIKLDPRNAEYRIMLAELYRDLGLKLRAKGEAERAVTVDPNNRKARDLLRTLK